MQHGCERNEGAWEHAFLGERHAIMPKGALILSIQPFGMAVSNLSDHNRHYYFPLALISQSQMFRREANLYLTDWTHSCWAWSDSDMRRPGTENVFTVSNCDTVTHRLLHITAQWIFPFPVVVNTKENIRRDGHFLQWPIDAVFGYACITHSMKAHHD